jgi:hypothetical protein
MARMTDSYVTQEEFKRLEARVATVEQETEGEKMVSRYILTQSRQNGDDLAALRTRVDRIEEKVDRLETGLGALRRDLPSMVADALRDVMRDLRNR